MTQHNEYSSIPQAVRDLVANKVSLLDEYILCQTGDNEYTALIRDLVTGDVKQIYIYRGSNYGAYSVVETDAYWSYEINNEYYCYSNIGLGSALDLPVYDGVQAHAAVIFTAALLFLIVFRSALFPFKRKK